MRICQNCAYYDKWNFWCNAKDRPTEPYDDCWEWTAK